MIINDNQLPGIRDSRAAFFALGGAGQRTIFWAEQGSKSSGRGGEKVKPVRGRGIFGAMQKYCPCCESCQIQFQLVSPNSVSMLLIFGNLIWAKWVALKAAQHVHLLVSFKNIFYFIQYFKLVTILPMNKSVKQITFGRSLMFEKGAAQESPSVVSR